MVVQTKLKVETIKGHECKRKEQLQHHEGSPEGFARSIAGETGNKKS